MSILGPDGGIANFPVSSPVVKKEPIIDMRIVVFQKMMVHPQTKEMVMVPMQDIQYQRKGSDEWFSMDGIQVENHEPNLENPKGE
jgi:hypothetical protein